GQAGGGRGPDRLPAQPARELHDGSGHRPQRRRRAGHRALHVMATATAAARTRSHPWDGFVDCDVHNGIPGPEALAPYLPEKWRRQWEDYGLRYVNRAAYCPGPRRGAIRVD